MNEKDKADAKALLEKLKRELFKSQMQDIVGESESNRLWREFMKSIKRDDDE